jgi:hypothetical protein
MMRWTAEKPSAARQILKRDREVTTDRRSAQRVSAAPVILATFFAAERMSAQAQNLDRQSGISFSPGLMWFHQGIGSSVGPTVVVFLSPARRKRDVGAAVANGDRM